MADWSFALPSILTAPLWQLFAAVVLSAIAFWALRGFVLQARSIAMRSALVISALAFWLMQMAFIFPPLQVSSRGDHIVVSPCPGAGQLDALDTRVHVWLLPRSESCVSVKSWLADTRKTFVVERVSNVKDVHSRTGQARVTLLGDGLPAPRWRDVPRHWQWLPPDELPFAALIDAPAQTTIGERVELSLALPGTEDGPVRVEISVDDRLVDDTETIDEQYRFLLSGLNAGNHDIGVVVRQGSREFAATVGMHVTSPLLARVLILNDAPAFEWRALQRWLSDSGAPLVVRSRISDARFRWYIANREALDARPALLELVADADLVILDGASLNTLGEDALRLLLGSDGDAPGVLLTLHDQKDVDAIRTQLPTLLSDVSSLPRVFRLDNALWSPDDGFSALAVEAALDRIWLFDETGYPLAGRVPTHPRLHVSLLRDSYRMIGAGHEADYASLWSSIVERIATPAATRGVNFYPRFVEQGQRLRICRFAADDNPLTLEIAGRELRADWQSPGWQRQEVCAWVWPEEPGWLLVKDATGAVLGASLIAAGGHWIPMERRENRVSSEPRQEVREDVVVRASSRAGLVPVDRRRLVVGLVFAALLHWLLQRLVTARRDDSDA
ncbi:MAG: hypothetical protein AAAFM81_13460 [Pseudomonadota bacterium]